MSKYYNISREIISKINSGDLLPGMRVPSENEIISKFKVSNTTARKVLNELEQAGYATKIKGKGTFVRVKNVERSVSRILGFSSNMRQSGLNPTTKVLGTEILKTGHSMTINGRWYTMKGPVLKINRLRFADNVPMMLEQRFISIEICPDIDKKDLQKSLYDIYEENYSLELTEVDQMLSAVIISNQDIKNHFKMTENTPAILVTGVTFCAKESILEMEESIYRGDKYSFSVKAK